MASNYKEQTVGNIVTKMPRAASLFQELNIDFCCGGERSLSEAAAESNLDPEAIAARLEKLAGQVENTARETDLTSLGPVDLTMLIEQQHHVWLRENMPIINELFNKVLLAHGINHPELFQLHSLYSELRGKLEQHLVKEEAMVFPLYAKANEEHAQIRELEATLKEEHEHAGSLLHEMRRVAADYNPPADACPTYELLLRRLLELETDLFQHIHKENNILFKMND